MENASKALLIAASVLIVILLIAMGVRVFNSTSGTADSLEGTMVTAEASQFNSKFTGYIGTKSKSQVISLLNQVIANNATNSRHPISIKNSSNTVDVATFLNTVANGTKTTYAVTISSTDFTNGYITTININ